MFLRPTCSVHNQRTIFFNPNRNLLPGIPIRTTLDNSTTVQYAGLLHQLTVKAKGTVRDIDPQNDLTFLRIRSKKHEIMVAPGNPGERGAEGRSKVSKVLRVPTVAQKVTNPSSVHEDVGSIAGLA